MIQSIRFSSLLSCTALLSIFTPFTTLANPVSQNIPVAQNKSARARPDSNKKSSQRPRLVVLMTIDQMRADTLERYTAALQKIAAGKSEGLLALKENGTWFSLGYTAGAPTVTAAGHASLCTGANPAKHGIVGNEIFDPQSQRGVASTADNTASDLLTPGLLPEDPLSRVKEQSSSARRLQTPTLADALREWSGGVSKTIALSLKDRGAVYCGGKNAAGVYWYDYKSGSMVSSTAFTSALPEWVNSFNSQRRSQFPSSWTPVLAVEDMQKLLPNEEKRKAFAVRSALSQWFGSGFPYTFKNESGSTLEVRQRFQYTPAASNSLVDFALEAVRQERLGCASRKAKSPCQAPEFPDLLTISFSTPDLVGHAFGPESPELMDIYLNLNRSIERLRKELHSALGEQNILFVFSSDHGVQPMPEVSQARGATAGRMVSKDIKANLEKVLREKWGEGPWIADLVTAEIHFRQETFTKNKKTTAEALSLLQDYFKSIKGVRGLLTRADIVNAATPEAEHYKRGHNPERSGEAVILLEKGWLLDSRNAATHGTAFDDDTRIPVVFSGWSVRPRFEIKDKARADDVAPTILELVGAKVTPSMTGKSFADRLRLKTR
jgi:arylsulfatase A-like enzyme